MKGGSLLLNENCGCCPSDPCAGFGDSIVATFSLISLCCVKMGSVYAKYDDTVDLAINRAFTLSKVNGYPFYNSNIWQTIFTYPPSYFALKSYGDADCSGTSGEPVAKNLLVAASCGFSSVGTPADPFNPVSGPWTVVIASDGFDYSTGYDWRKILFYGGGTAAMIPNSQLCTPISPGIGLYQGCGFMGNCTIDPLPPPGP